MLPTINSSRSNRPPSHPHPPPLRKPSASEVLSLVAAKYAELFHYLHTVPPPAPPPSTPSNSSPTPSATLSPSTAEISNAIFQTHNDDHRDDKIKRSHQTSPPAAQQAQALLTPHELAAIHHAAAWSLAQQPHLLLEAREQRRTDNSSDQQAKRQSHPEPNDERVANGDFGKGKGEGESDDGGRELSRLLRRELAVLDDSHFPSTSVPTASTAAMPPQNLPPPCDRDHHATIDPAEPGSSDRNSDDEVGHNDPGAIPEGGEEAEDAAAKSTRGDHDQHDYNQAFTAVLERTRIDYLALKGLVRMYLCAWQARKNERGGGSNEEETAEERGEAEEEREKRWRSAAEKKAAIELACRRYAQTFEAELRERRERDSSSLVTVMDQRSSGLPHIHQQRSQGNPLLQHLQKQRLPVGASQQIPQHRRGERRGEEVVDGWAERWVRPVVQWREEGKRVLPAGREDEGEDKVDWKSILAHGSEKVKSVTREENQDVQAVGHQSLKHAASNGCKEEVVEGASRSFDGNGVGHGDVTLIPRGAKRKRQISLHALNELGSAEFNSSTGVRAAAPFSTPLPPQTPWTASGNETRDRMWSQCLDRMNGAESRSRVYPSEPYTISNNHHTTRPSDHNPSPHLPSDLTQNQVRTWYNRWQELRNSPYRGNEHDERELQRLSALLAEAQPLIAQWKREDATVREPDPKRRREDVLGVRTNAWTMGMEQDTIGFGSPIQNLQPKRLPCEPLFSPAGEGNSITPSWSALSSAFGRAPARQQYQYQHQHQRQHQYPHHHQPSPQQPPHQSFSHSFAIPTTHYHQDQPAQRQPEPQQHKRIDSYESLANDSFTHHTNHFPMTPAHQLNRQTRLQPPSYSDLSTPTSDAAQSWDIRPLSTTTNTSDFVGMAWAGEGSAQGGPFGNYNGNTASGTNLHGGQRNGTSFLPSSPFPSAAATTTPTPVRTSNDLPGTSSDLPLSSLDDDQASEPSRADMQRQDSAPFSAAAGNDAFDPLDFSRDSGWDDARFSAAFGQETWMEDWAEAAGKNGDLIV
ncbi:hypothetical protein KC343_g8380 [Hortaea werneckii]|nr:hypothetical protein KC352_g19544 [Hortaea werneckii]KAI7561326.1 hypothetical protein KC317_g9138 [Hortaea werneckii]KAI7611363.1 hypothetical protein KC346_g8327 [Hortaea werneckii]KAI7620455.1 hypothetical protein KC343_g8380 [Hortaea werneckii]KAI7654742.1 hypothetical protein KC319_g10197 [Hortaea werneckii]